MVIGRGHDGSRQERARHRLVKVASLTLGVIMFGTVGLSGALAQDDDVSAGIADADALVNSIIAEIFGEIFGGDVAADEAAASGGGDLNIGGSTGSTVTMGGGGDISIGGGSSGGVTVGDDSGG
jgi:hypothetical protein